MLSFEFCSLSVEVGASSSVHYHFNNTYVNVDRYLVRTSSPKVTESIWLAQFSQILPVKLVVLRMMYNK